MSVPVDEINETDEELTPLVTVPLRVRGKVSEEALARLLRRAGVDQAQIPAAIRCSRATVPVDSLPLLRSQCVVRGRQRNGHRCRY